MDIMDVYILLVHEKVILTVISGLWEQSGSAARKTGIIRSNSKVERSDIFAAILDEQVAYIEPKPEMCVF